MNYPKLLKYSSTQLPEQRIIKRERQRKQQQKGIEFSTRSERVEDLEARERAILEQTAGEKTESAEKKLQQVIERLRKEGSRLLEQEQERLRQELKRTTVKDENISHVHKSEVARIKLKWKAQKGDPMNGGYSMELLQNILSCYGNINTLIVSSKRCGSAIVEFEDSGVASDMLGECGFPENPLTMVWLSGKPVIRTPASGFQ